MSLAVPIESDQDLRAMMLAYQSGSRDAFQSIYISLAPALERYLRHLTRGANHTDDMVQETFLHMHRSRDAYNPDHPVKPWLFGLARNVFLMHRRAFRRWSAVHHATCDLPEYGVPAEVESLGSADEVRRCIAVLDEDQAEALLLHHEWGFTFDEIAGMLGVSSAAARARASRGMSVLRDALTDLRKAKA